MDKFKRNKMLFGIQILLILGVFFALYLASNLKIPRYTPFVILLSYGIVAYLRFSFNRREFIIKKVNRTKPLQTIIMLLPVLAVLLYFSLPSEKGLNILATGITYVISVYIEEKLTVYEDRAAVVEKAKKQTKSKKKGR